MRKLFDIDAGYLRNAAFLKKNLTYLFRKKDVKFCFPSNVLTPQFFFSKSKSYYFGEFALLVLFIIHTTSGIVLSEFVPSGDPLYLFTYNLHTYLPNIYFLNLFFQGTLMSARQLNLIIPMDSNFCFVIAETSAISLRKKMYMMSKQPLSKPCFF